MECDNFQKGDAVEDEEYIPGIPASKYSNIKCLCSLHSAREGAKTQRHLLETVSDETPDGREMD